MKPMALTLTALWAAWCVLGLAAPAGDWLPLLRGMAEAFPDSVSPLGVLFVPLRVVSLLLPALLFAFVIGDTCRVIGTGGYVAGVVEAGLPAAVVPATLFIVSGITSFSTGTSWGTWAIMIPIAIPMIDIVGLHTSLVIASVLGGGIFGDHCSPISDSTIMSSMSAGSDHIDHVRTQLPYALRVAGVTVLLYLILGVVL